MLDTNLLNCVIFVSAQLRDIVAGKTDSWTSSGLDFVGWCLQMNKVVIQIMHWRIEAG